MFILNDVVVVVVVFCLHFVIDFVNNNCMEDKMNRTLELDGNFEMNFITVTGIKLS